MRTKQTLISTFTTSFQIAASVILLSLVSFQNAWAQSCPAPTFDFENPSLVSGTYGGVNSVYRFDDVLTNVDAIVTIVSKSHNDIVISSLDEPAITNGGYDWAFQPIIDYDWYNGDGTSDPIGDRSVTFQFDFVDASTSSAVNIALMHMTAVDIDGNGFDLREFVESSAFQAYEIQSPSELNLSGSLRAMGDYPAHDGVEETALTTMISYVFENKSSIQVTYGANMNASADDLTAEERLNCLYFKCYDFNTTVPCPTVNAGSNITLCSGSSATFTATAPGAISPYTFSWSHGLGTGAGKTVSPSSTTTYTVTLTNGNGCTTTDDLTVTVNQTPIADASSDETICRFFDTNISASASGGTTPYQYNWDNGLIGNQSSFTVSPLNTTTYTVTVTSANGCNDTDQVTVTVQFCAEDCSNGSDDDGDGLVDCADPDCGPTADAGNDLNNCPGQDIQIGVSASGGNGVLTYNWDNGATGQSQIVNPLTTTTYTVTVSAPSGCTAVDQVTVNVVTCGEDCTNGIDDDSDGLIDCADPDCVATAAPDLVDDSYSSCPAMPYSERVTYNDNNLQNPVYSIYTNPSNGTVIIDATGKFTYTPSVNDCMVDQFMYQVCNQASGCCSQATVTINLADATSPTLINVPADVTIGCDDAVPTPPNVTAFDECPGIFIDFDEVSSQHYGGACESYTITRTWTATDLCGNQATDTQEITVVDNTKPEIFQVYTLENGTRIVAGVSKNVTHDWKYVPFPITFSETPMIFTTVNTNNELSAVTVRQRNAYSQGFELRLFEQEAADGQHLVENVSWIAIESGTNDGTLKLDAGRWQNIDDNVANLSFSSIFGANPAMIVAMQSTNDEDPAVVRVNSLSNGSVALQIAEEGSDDAETTHGLEHVGFVAFDAGENLIDEKGHAFGETGKINLTNAWTSITLNNSYTKPVIVFGGISNNDGEGVNVRVRNVTGNSFEVRLQEWDYLDGNHSPESVSWIVMEGAIPGNMGYYCSGSVSDLEIGINIFALDNCDDQTSFGYTETPSTTSSGTLTTRVWMAIDDCGNTNLITRYDTCSTAALQLRAQLHGAKVNSGNSGLMRDDLRTKDFVPLEEPFSSLPAFPHVEDTTPNSDDGANTGNGNDGPNQANLPPNAELAYFKTIADGNWFDPDTWENGNVPALYDTVRSSISVEHFVTIDTGNLWMTNNSELFVTNGGIDILDGSLTVFKAKGVFNNSTINVSKTLSTFKLLTSESELHIKDCNLTVGHNFTNGNGVRKLENICMTIGNDFSNSGGEDTLINVTITADKGFYNNLFGDLYVHNSRLSTVNGDFWNTSSGQIEGDSITLWAQNGGISNSGQWNAQIIKYCVAGSATNLGASLPISEDCAGMPDLYANCESLLMPTVINPGGPGNSTVDAAFISLEGTLDPVLLEIEGQEAVVDWLLLEIRDPNTEEVVEYATVALQRDGDIMSEDGQDIINFPDLIEGDYLVTIRHRNHLPLMTDVPMFLSVMNPPMIDFSDPALPVRGGNVGGNESNGERAMWGGDFNEDDKVIYQGPNNDIFYLFSRALSDVNNVDYLANFIINEYDVHDFNLDGNVIYQGPNNDRASLLYFTVLSHSSNSGFLANYIARGYLP